MKKTKNIKIGVATVNQTPFDWENNLTNIINAINLAIKNKCSYVFFPELSITGYGCEDWFNAEWLVQSALEKTIKLLPYSTSITIGVGLPYKFKENIYNSYMVLSNGEIKGIYLKKHLANSGLHYEPRWFKGRETDEAKLITLNEQKTHIGNYYYVDENVKIGFEICEDAWRNQDRPAHLHKKNGIDLIINPSASHFAFGKVNLREKIIQDAVQDNKRIGFVYCNLLGNESGRTIYDGDIIFADSQKIHHANKRFGMQDFYLKTALFDIENKKFALEDVHNPVLTKNEEFTQAATLGLFDYARKTRSKGYVVSLSGGADSSACATLVAHTTQRALNERGLEYLVSLLKIKTNKQQTEKEILLSIKNKMLFCAYQGTANSSEETYNSAKSLALSLGATFKSWEIDNIIDSSHKIITDAIERPLTWEQDDIALQNIQARSRSPLIWMITNIRGALLISTSNRSEADVGYATMDGDTSGSISPVAGISKPFLLQWLVYAEKELGYKGLKKVNNLIPTAELRPKDKKQTDEDDLMPYPILELIENHAILYKKKPEDVLLSLQEAYPNEKKELLTTYVKRFFALWARNQWKRERYAPSFHYDDFNVDPRSWCRFPIISGGFAEELENLTQ